MKVLSRKLVFRWTAVCLIMIAMIASAVTVSAQADENTISFGSEGTKLEKGKTYIVPVALKNANLIQQDSMAKSCLGKYAALTVGEDGTAALQSELYSVVIGSVVDYAKDFKIYQGKAPSGATSDAEVVSEQEVTGADGTVTKVPKEIKFQIPSELKAEDGVYISMYVGTMQSAPNAYIRIDYEKAKEKGSSYEKDGTAQVQQFGKYNIGSKITVTDGKISKIELAGSDFKGTYADMNQAVLQKAITGMKDQFVGLYDTDADAINKVDSVTGATTSSRVIKESVLNALELKNQQEEVAEAPEKVTQGTYKIKIKDKSDIVDHSMIEEEKNDAVLRVEKDGTMSLSLTMVSGTKKEPLYVLGYNGYYKDNDFSTDENLTKSGSIWRTGKADEYTVITDLQFPLYSLQQFYYKNVYLYVPAMKNLNGDLSGVQFDNGKFNIKSTITMYWDTLEKINEADKTQLKTLFAKTESVDRKAYTSTSLAVMDKAAETAKELLFNVNATDAQIKSTASALNKAISGLTSNVKAPAAPTSVKASRAAYNKVKISWKKVSGAAGYEVYQYNSKTKKYAKTASAKGTSYTKSGLTTGTKYSYKVRAYKTAGGKTIYSAYSKTASAAPTLSKVTTVKAKNSAKKTAKVTWKKVDGASGYKIYRSTKKSSKYKAVKTITKGKTVKYTNKKLKKGKKYYYKIRAYKKIGKKTVYGSYSSAASVKIKK